MAARAVKAVSNTEETKVLEFKSATDKADRVTLFTIDDTEYTVPAKVGVNVSLRYLNSLRKNSNEMMAALELLEALLGEDSYNALLSWEDLDSDILGQILDQCVELAMGSSENAAGK